MRMRSSLAFIVLIASGCGAAIEQSKVARRFETTFSCGSSHTYATSGGYRVEGCGVTAHYACFAKRRHYHADEREGSVAGIVAAALVDAAFQVDECVMEHSERAPVTHATAGAETLPFVSSDASGPLVKLRLPVEGGRLVFLGRPLRHPEHLLLSVHSQRRLPPTCLAELYDDGVPVPVERVERAGDFEARVLLRVEALRTVGLAARFAGQLCGLEVELDDPSRKALSHFAARFAEERARHAAEERVASRQPAVE